MYRLKKITKIAICAICAVCAFQVDPEISVEISGREHFRSHTRLD